MGMRITTNGVFHGYRKDLGNSYFRMSKSMTRVTTQRNFGAYSEDVSAASRAFQLRRSHWRASNQITNSNYVISKFQTGWSAIDYIVDGDGSSENINGIVEAMQGLNSPTGSARVTLGQSAINKAESIVRLLNTQYGDQFIFAGANGRNVPFSWETDEQTGETYLAYRGIDVNTPAVMTKEELQKLFTVKMIPGIPGDDEVDLPVESTPDTWKLNIPDALKEFDFGLDFDTEYTSAEDAKAALEGIDFDAVYDEYLNKFDEVYAGYVHGEENGSAMANYEKLCKMAEETTYVDIGIGVNWYDPSDDAPIPDLISSSAYNSALNGLTFIGFGSVIDEDGELRSNNLASLMMQMGNMLTSCDDVTGQFPEGWDVDRVSALTRKIASAVNDVTTQHVKLSNEVNYLETNLYQLTAQRDALNDQILEIEQIDPADAITEFLYARYSYNAALQVGGSILTNTLLDYLR